MPTVKTALFIAGSIALLGVATVLLVIVAIIPVARSTSLRSTEHLIPQHLQARLLEDGTTVEI
jgi:hypothetical protein